MNILNTIESIYERGEFSYLLSTYVDSEFWIQRLKDYFGGRYIDNLTDFNYNKCFSIYINLSDVDSGLGTKEFDNYIIKNNNLYRMIIEISALAPYCIVKYSRYYMENGEVQCQCSDKPFCKEHIEFAEIISEFILKFKLILLDDDMLMAEVANKSLELREAPVSAYNCLFEDTYAYYPYTNKAID